MSYPPVRKAVFPAAGLGTRFLPATKATPKEMLPIVDAPLIQYAIEEVANAGIEEVIIVTGRGKRAIEDHFDLSFELDYFLEQHGKSHMLDSTYALLDRVQISYVRQRQPLGLGHAVACGRRLGGNEPFAVVLADDLIYTGKNCVLGQMVSVFGDRECSILGVVGSKKLGGAVEPGDRRPLHPHPGALRRARPGHPRQRRRDPAHGCPGLPPRPPAHLRLRVHRHPLRRR